MAETKKKKMKKKEEDPFKEIFEKFNSYNEGTPKKSLKYAAEDD